MRTQLANWLQQCSVGQPVALGSLRYGNNHLTLYTTQQKPGSQGDGDVYLLKTHGPFRIPREGKNYYRANYYISANGKAFYHLYPLVTADSALTDSSVRFSGRSFCLFGIPLPPSPNPPANMYGLLLLHDFIPVWYNLPLDLSSGPQLALLLGGEAAAGSAMWERSPIQLTQLSDPEQNRPLVPVPEREVTPLLEQATFYLPEDHHYNYHDPMKWQYNPFTGEKAVQHPRHDTIEFPPIVLSGSQSTD